MFENWELWQIILTAVFGTVWIVFIVLDTRRKIAAKKREKDKQSANVHIYSGEQGNGKKRKL